MRPNNTIAKFITTNSAKLFTLLPPCGDVVHCTYYFFHAMELLKWILISRGAQNHGAQSTDGLRLRRVYVHGRCDS